MRVRGMDRGSTGWRWFDRTRWEMGWHGEGCGLMMEALIYTRFDPLHAVLQPRVSE